MMGGDIVKAIGLLLLLVITDRECNSTTTRIPYAQGIRPAQVETTTPPAAPAAGSAHQDRACEFVECPMKAEDREKCVSDIDMANMMPPSNQQHALGQPVDPRSPGRYGSEPGLHLGRDVLECHAEERVWLTV
ncbi:hypothetical protein J4Q44_G00185850 [Coregonus suidteri]|uniref:Uncharacterized protein n=1 Tax=Coregonus suidteri TaxID=861788 RepID=A0AAN8LG56_9TELE